MKKINLFIILLIVLPFLTVSNTYAQWAKCKGLENAEIVSYAYIGDLLFDGSGNGIVYTSLYSQLYWNPSDTLAQYYDEAPPNGGVPVTFPPTVVLFADGNNLFVGINYGVRLPGINPEVVRLSSDGGLRWTVPDSGFVQNIYCFSMIGSTLIAGTGNGVFLSTNNGISWKAFNNGLNYGDYDSAYGHPPPVNSLTVEGKYIFAWTGYGGVFRTTDTSLTWTQVNNGLTNLSTVGGLAVIGNNVFAGVYASDSTGGVFLSSDNGMNWHSVDSGMTNHLINTLIASGTNLYAGNDTGIFISTNNGGNWYNISIAPIVGPHSAISLGVEGSYLFAGTNNSGVWRIPLSQLLTGVKSGSPDIPSGFALEQNYPNPFNPSTTIKYSVPKTSLVTIKIYDVLGNAKATLVNEEKSPGNYSIEFSASGGSALGGNAGRLASGVYFYRMQAGSFIETKKFMLMK